MLRAAWHEAGGIAEPFYWAMSLKGCVARTDALRTAPAHKAVHGQRRTPTEPRPYYSDHANCWARATSQRRLSGNSNYCTFSHSRPCLVPRARFSRRRKRRWRRRKEEGEGGELRDEKGSDANPRSQTSYLTRPGTPAPRLPLGLNRGAREKTPQAAHQVRPDTCTTIQHERGSAEGPAVSGFAGRPE